MPFIWGFSFLCLLALHGIGNWASPNRNQSCSTDIFLYPYEIEFAQSVPSHRKKQLSPHYIGTSYPCKLENIFSHCGLGYTWKQWEKISLSYPYGARCAIFGAKLAEIETAEEDSFIRIHLLDSGRKDAFWIGGTDAQKEGHWIWVKDRVKISYSDWLPNQPDNQNNNEHCLQITGDQYKWNDNDCDKEYYYYLCEEELGIRNHTLRNQ